MVETQCSAGYGNRAKSQSVRVVLRLAKYIASMGFCSRRKGEELIAANKVTINGQIALITSPVDPQTDDIRIEGNPLSAPRFIYIMLNKPPGYLSTCCPGQEKGKSALELVTVESRIFPVGRLDKASRGLLILTNDGNLTYKLTHPSFAKEKEYIVRTDAAFSQKALQLLTTGISLNNTIGKFHNIERIGDCQYRIILLQGIKRQIRLMAKAVGIKVLDLQRIRIHNLLLSDLPQGKWRYLTETEIASLFD